MGKAITNFQFAVYLYFIKKKKQDVLWVKTPFFFFRKRFLFLGRWNLCKWILDIIPRTANCGSSLVLALPHDENLNCFPQRKKTNTILASFKGFENLWKAIIHEPPRQTLFKNGANTWGYLRWQCGKNICKNINAIKQ